MVNSFKYLPFLFLYVINNSCELFSASLSGRVTDSDSNPMPGVSITLKGTTYGAISDVDGQYEIHSIPAGVYTIIVSSIGFEPLSKVVSLKPSQHLSMMFLLNKAVSALDEVVIYGDTEAEEISSKPITITSLDATLIRDQAVGVAEVLKRSTGVLVRRSGGLGSDALINLNGLTGNAVRVYYDGIPLEYLGGGIEINNLPVNLIDRIDVYKGVMPISVGTDALGGGINIIPRQTYNDYFEASYEIGSFNTHRVSIMGLKSLNNNLFVGVNSFFNYSDNDYLMDDIPNRSIEVFENRFGRMDTALVESSIEARRFNDRHISTYFEGQLGILQKKWADRLIISSSYSYRHDQVQHGRRVTIRPAGEAKRNRTSFIQKISYSNKLWNRLNLSYTGIYSYTKDNVDDSTRNLYNWLGTVLPLNNNRGAEVLSRPTGRQGKNTGTSHRLTLSYRLNKIFKFSLSDFYAYSRIIGEDPYGIRVKIGDEQIDPNETPSHFTKNILGAEVSSKWLKEKLSASLFHKNYFYRAESIDITQQRANQLFTRINENNTNGYGSSIKYAFNDDLFIRSSYERTLRIPTEREIYGDFLLIIPNYNLKPELSDNYNLGFFTRHNWKNHRSVAVDVNGFIRDQQNLIRLEVLGAGESAQYINEAEASAKGMEVSIKARPIKKLRVVTNFTYQDVTLAASDRIQNDSFVGVQIPNIPDVFFNSTIQYEFSPKLTGDDKLSFFWNYFFVDQFSITYVIDESQANPDNLVPTQNQHDIGVSYAPSHKGFEFSFQINNLTNNHLFDNFRVPKPGRNYSFKINYSI